MSSSSNSSILSIGRHTAQLILRSAMLAEPTRCCGLIGMNNQQIEEAAIMPNQAATSIKSCVMNDTDVRNILDQWQIEGISCCGLFTSSPTQTEPDVNEIKALECVLKNALSANNTSPLFHLFVSLNTKGCLETFAYQFTNDRLTQIPLLLNEDGQQPVSS